MADGKLNVFNLGNKGVVLTKAPTHNEDGELSSAQNAILDTDAREGAIRKRPGLTKVNSSSLAGSVLGAVHVPLPDSGSGGSGGAITRSLWIPRRDNSFTGNSWLKSTDGTTWAGQTSPTYFQDESNLAGDDLLSIAAVRGKIYFPSYNFTAGSARPPLNVWDGTTDSIVLTVPTNITAGAATYERISAGMLSAEGYLYFTAITDAGATVYSRVFQYNPETGRVLQVGPSLTVGTGGTETQINDLAWFEGRLWACTRGDSEGQIFSIRPPSGTFIGDTAWITEHTATSTLSLYSMASYKGKLYVGTSVGTVIVRSTTGTFSTSDTASAANSQYSGLFVYQDNLYAAQAKTVANTFVYRKFDGTSWTTDFDIKASIGYRDLFVSKPVSFNGSMYGIVDGGTNLSHVLKNASGTWSSVALTDTVWPSIAILEEGL